MFNKLNDLKFKKLSTCMECDKIIFDNEPYECVKDEDNGDYLFCVECHLKHLSQLLISMIEADKVCNYAEDNLEMDKDYLYKLFGEFGQLNHIRNEIFKQHRKIEAWKNSEIGQNLLLLKKIEGRWF